MLEPDGDSIKKGDAGLESKEIRTKCSRSTQKDQLIKLDQGGKKDQPRPLT